MGYAGYVPAKLPPSSLTPVQTALFLVSSVSSLELIEKLVYNAVVSPQEPKFKKVRLGNPRIKAAIIDTPAALEAMLAMGWQQAQEGEESVLLLSKSLSMAVVRDVQEAASRAKKAAQEAQRTAQRAAAAKPAALPGSDSRESLRAMLEADRRERAARGPVSVGSVAQPLPSAGGGGPARIRTAGEAGLNSG
ncbi:hypothetical protein ACKKBG_A02235 [Auxenochlorella protothecoides x Auxenochlorella symbiontica]